MTVADHAIGVIFLW